jgi:hypothetical protein
MNQDRADIRALWTAYTPALLGCKGEEYADLFATPAGYFGSGPRGEVSVATPKRKLISALYWSPGLVPPACF